LFNELLMQFQADILGVPVIRPKVAETTALGAAYAAGLAIGFWNDLVETIRSWSMDKQWMPSIDSGCVGSYILNGKKAVTRHV